MHRALARTTADRYATAAEFAQALHPGVSTPVATPAVVPARGPGPGPAAPTIAVEQPVSPESARRRVPVAAVSLGLGILIGLGVLFAWRRSHLEGDSSGGAKLVAILPFENLGRPEDEYFADGVTDEVRGKLATLPGLKVIARSSSSQLVVLIPHTILFPSALFRHPMPPPQRAQADSAISRSTARASRRGG